MSGRGTAVNLTRNGRLETASTQTKPAYAGFKSLNFPLVRVVRQAQRKRDRRTLPV
ncbi:MULTISPECIES: hypothetical protein [Nostoc]|uniref:Uncharacterized protein n=1 Tax=Nostoc paludosum FACHB-159 TaxID=2692908 RepID=A0ABR8K295_9NOSO|nr:MULTISPECIES: hypothetical protein [Nostoc]MBD2681789.1 hypothetical protein [Nostoc sp. FACHB-857]MBD2733547.1 hypothetical protein [Nostoc paludosum FACHB-159]